MFSLLSILFFIFFFFYKIFFFSLVSDECSQSGRSGFEVITEEWGTSGMIRAKVADLINIFRKAGIDRAALRLCENLKGILSFYLD